MILKTDTHEFTCTRCRRTGRPCFEAVNLAKALAESTLFARPLLAPDFEMSGFTLLEQCGLSCPAPFRVTKTEVYVSCDVADDDAVVALAGRVQDLKGANRIQHPRKRIPASKRIPAAVVIARLREQQIPPLRPRTDRLARFLSNLSARIRQFAVVQSDNRTLKNVE